MATPEGRRTATGASPEQLATTLGTPTDAEATTGNGTLIAISKAVRTFLTGKATAGAQGNAWTAIAVGINGVSTALALADRPFVSAFGSASIATTITLQLSANGTTFYDGPTQVLSAAGDFAISVTTGAAHVRLKSSAAATITATIMAKG